MVTHYILFVNSVPKMTMKVGYTF